MESLDSAKLQRLAHLRLERSKQRRTSQTSSHADSALEEAARARIDELEQAVRDHEARASQNVDVIRSLQDRLSEYQRAELDMVRTKEELASALGAATREAEALRLAIFDKGVEIASFESRARDHVATLQSRIAQYEQTLESERARCERCVREHAATAQAAQDDAMVHKRVYQYTAPR